MNKDFSSLKDNFNKIINDNSKWNFFYFCICFFI
jgi:hypothetical protein